MTIIAVIYYFIFNYILNVFILFWWQYILLQNARILLRNDIV